MQTTLTTIWTPAGTEYFTAAGELVAVARHTERGGAMLEIAPAFRRGHGFPLAWPTLEAAGFAVLALAACRPVRGLTAEMRASIKNAARDAMEFWPNGHLGEYSRRSDLRSAFGVMRRRFNDGEPITIAAAYVATDAQHHQDM